MTRSAGRKGGKVATGIKPAGTKARMLPGFALGRPPPPGDPGWGKLLGVRPGAGFAAISIATIARTVAAIPGNDTRYSIICEKSRCRQSLVILDHQ